jgi:hypothetical protein
MMQKSTSFTTIFRVKKVLLSHTILRVKKCNFHYYMQKKFICDLRDGEQLIF